MLIGLISDTHGLLRPQVFKAFEGVDLILHAGDVGDPDILTALEAIAPVTAVWGNTDGWEIRDLVPEVARVTIGGGEALVVHGMQFGSPTPKRVVGAHADALLVVFGHSHVPVIERVGATLAVNPGSAGPRRLNLPTTVALATVEGDSVEARLVQLLD
jgi:putative phosphoesterase